MNIKMMAAAIALAALPVAAVQAADNSNKAYVYLGAGATKLTQDDVDEYYDALADSLQSVPGVSGKRTSEDASVAFALGAGYQLNAYVAAELFYRNYGKSKDGVDATDGFDYLRQQDEIKASGFGVGLVGSWPVTPEISLFARVDAVNLKVEDDFSLNSSITPSYNATDEDTNLKMGFGLGAQCNLENGFALRAEYLHIKGELEYDNGSSVEGNIDTVAVSLIKYF